LQPDGSTCETLLEKRHGGLENYVRTTYKDGTWGDGITLLVSSIIYRQKIVVFADDKVQSNQPMNVSHDPGEDCSNTMYIGFVEGNHYVSLVSKPSSSTQQDNAEDGKSKLSSIQLDTEKTVGNKMREVNGRQTLEHPDCWTSEQWLGFQTEYPWLICESHALGCRTCGEVKVIGPGGAQGVGGHNTVSDEWANCKVKPYGTGRSEQLMSLRKKIWKHKKSAVHTEACKVLLTRDKDELKANVVSQQEEQYRATCNVFRTAYYIAKNNRPYTDHSGLIDLQRLNGVDVGRLLHSPTTCVDIVDHIAEQMSSKLMKSVLESDVPFSILIDESTTLSNKACLVVYIRCSIDDSKPCSLFLDVIELSGSTAVAIGEALVKCLYDHKFTDSILKNRWLALGTDGASVMLGRKCGVLAKLQQTYPNIIGWHCINHRLELSVHDVVKCMTDINHLKSFMDKLYSLYSRSPKARRELQECAAELGSQVYKIGRILDVRWSASSFRTVKAVWKSYASLHAHFAAASKDTFYDVNDRALYAGLLKKLTNQIFLKNLALFYDALEELADLSEALQQDAITLATANRKIQRTMEVFASRKDSPGCFYKEAITAIAAGKFQGVPLSKAGKREHEINCRQFYQGLVDSMGARLLSDADKKFSNLVTITYPESYQTPLPCSPDHGESELREMCVKFKLPFSATKEAFREFKDSKGAVITQLFRKLLFAIDTIPVSTAACERGFSIMNGICTPTRSLLTVPHIASCMIIHTSGPPVTLWNPQSYVRSWLANDRRDATSLHGMTRLVKPPTPHETMYSVWKVLT